MKPSKNNGYRWPGGEEEDHAKQEQTKMGAAGWKETFPNSPWPSDIPGFAPFALYLSGTMFNYSDKVADKTGALKTPQTLNWAAGTTDARILFGGTVSETIGIVGAIESIATGSTTTNLRAVWSFSPGVNLSYGSNGFSAFRGLGSPISAYTNVFPAQGVGPEFNYAVGKEGGLNIIAGVSDITDAPNGTTTSISGAEASETLKTTKNLSAANKLDDFRYLRVKYKLFGAGLLSGAGGTYGNEYVGLDNSLAIGGSLVSARDNMLSTGGGNETLIYGADIAGNYGNFTAGVAYSRDRDLKLDNYVVDAGYYIYPWLLPRVTYKYLGLTGGLDNPTVAASVTAYLRANVFIKAAYTAFTHNLAPATASTTGVNNANTFALSAGLAF